MKLIRNLSIGKSPQKVFGQVKDEKFSFPD